jgi:hypothetical protein
MIIWSYYNTIKSYNLNKDTYDLYWFVWLWCIMFVMDLFGLGPDCKCIGPDCELIGPECELPVSDCLRMDRCRMQTDRCRLQVPHPPLLVYPNIPPLYPTSPPQALCDVVAVPQGFFVDKMRSLEIWTLCFFTFNVFNQNLVNMLFGNGTNEHKMKEKCRKNTRNMNGKWTKSVRKVNHGGRRIKKNREISWETHAQKDGQVFHERPSNTMRLWETKWH